MPNYFYIAKNLKGETISGYKEAENKHSLAKELREEGYILISVKVKNASSVKKGIVIPFLSKISLTDKVVFTRNLKVMVSAGVSLPRALDVLAEQTKNKCFKKIIFNLKEEIVKGKNLSQSLALYPNVFNDLFINMIKVGEESGSLEEVLSILAKQMEKDHRLVSRVRGAMMYPLVVITAMVIIGVLMMIMVIPKLSKVFSDLKINLPLTTRIVIASGNFMAKYWFLVISFFIFSFFLLRGFLKTEQGRKIKDKIFLKIPLVSSIIQKTNSARTARTISSLIKAGVSIDRSLKITANTLGNVYYRQALLKSSQEIKKGTRLSDILGNYKDIYPSLVIQMIKVGEETGETAEILEHLANFYEEEVDNITKNFSSIIEPFLMLIVGAAVGFFAISIIQPIYGIVQGF